MGIDIKPSYQITTEIGIIGLKYTHFLAKVLKYKCSEDTPPPTGGFVLRNNLAPGRRVPEIQKIFWPPTAAFFVHKAPAQRQSDGSIRSVGTSRVVGHAGTQWIEYFAMVEAPFATRKFSKYNYFYTRLLGTVSLLGINEPVFFRLFRFIGAVQSIRNSLRCLLWLLSIYLLCTVECSKIGGGLPPLGLWKILRISLGFSKVQ